MRTSEHTAPVIDLALLRPRTGTRSTFMLRVSTFHGSEEIFRYIGIDEASSLNDVAHALGVSFGLTGHCAVPAGFAASPGEPDPDTRFDPAATLADVLGGLRTTIYYNWGLWRFDLELVETYPRDDNTPHAVCVAGSGAFGDTPLNLSAINRELLGDDTAGDVLRLARPEVRSIVARSAMHDFVLLLKALDLGRDSRDSCDSGEGASERASISELPVERTRAGRDAFWASALALACLADPETTDRIIAGTYDALGYTGVSAVKVRGMCAVSLARLARAGGTSPVERLDTFRELFRG